MATTGKGFAFSVDLATAFIAMLLMLSLMLNQAESIKEANAKGLEKLSLQERAVFTADAMVKNRDKKNPLAGTALEDREKHRVLQNEIDLQLLQKAKPGPAGDYTVNRLSIATGQKVREIFSTEQGKNCIGLDRIALAEGEIAKLEVTVCE